MDDTLLDEIMGAEKSIPSLNESSTDSSCHNKKNTNIDLSFNKLIDEYLTLDTSYSNNNSSNIQYNSHKYSSTGYNNIENNLFDIDSSDSDDEIDDSEYDGGLSELYNFIFDEKETSNNTKNTVVLSSAHINNRNKNGAIKLSNRCCLCGCVNSNHTSQRHKFFPCLESYRCKKCYRFFYQHNHSNNPCFEPFKHIA